MQPQDTCSRAFTRSQQDCRQYPVIARLYGSMLYSPIEYQISAMLQVYLQLVQAIAAMNKPLPSGIIPASSMLPAWGSLVDLCCVLSIPQSCSFVLLLLLRPTRRWLVSLPLSVEAWREKYQLEGAWARNIR